MIVAPHTHWVDFFIGIAVRKKMGFEFVHFLGKSELFWPPLGWLLRYLGAYPVNRQHKQNMVDQVVEIFNKKERFESYVLENDLFSGQTKTGRPVGRSADSAVKPASGSVRGVVIFSG